MRVGRTCEVRVGEDMCGKGGGRTCEVRVERTCVVRVGRTCEVRVGEDM